MLLFIKNIIFIFPTLTLIDDGNYYTLCEPAHIHMSTMYTTHDTTHTHTHAHTHIYTYIHSYIHTYKQTYGTHTHDSPERKRTIGLHIGFRDTTRPSDWRETGILTVCRRVECIFLSRNPMR